MTKPSLPDLLHAAVTAVGGTERPGQVTMAEAVAEAIDDNSHLLVQAGTGTGKSLGYLVAGPGPGRAGGGGHGHPGAPASARRA